MITSITRHNGQFRITVEPTLTRPFRGLTWGTRFEHEGQEYIVQGSEPYVAKNGQLVYMVDAVPLRDQY